MRQAILSRNLTDLRDAIGFMKRFMQHPIGIGIIAFSSVVYVVGSAPPITPGLGGPMSGLIVAVCLLLYIYLGPGPAALFVRMGLRRNIPFALTYSVFISSFCCLDALVYVLIGAEGHTLEALPMRCLRRVIFAVAVHLPYFIIAEKNIRAAMGRVPDLVPVFRPVNLPEDQDAPAAFLETGLQENVVSLKAANQYVVVFTGEAEHLLRMTLKEAIDRLPPQTGLRVHRSWWLSRQELSGASLNKATGVLVTVTGRTYPVGKTKLAEVQALIGRPLSAVKG